MDPRHRDWDALITAEGQLNLAGQSIKDEELLGLTQFMQQHPDIRSLNLSAYGNQNNNRITAKGCQILAKQLKDHESLVALHLNHNELGNDGVQYLANLRHLTLLDIAGTGINEQGLLSLTPLTNLISLN